MNFNQSPYFDDFDEQKKFYRVLFRPGVAVQTREVNQLQSILQNQITKFGNHVFKNGSMVIPGQVNYNDKLRYLKLSSFNLGVESLSWLQDKTLVQNSNGTGINALVVAAIDATTTDPATLVLLYTQSNQDVTGANDATEFAANTQVFVREDSTKSVTSAPVPASGRSVAAAIQQGVYYINGYFVSVDPQVVVVKKYADDVTDINAKLGLQYTESVVTSDTDSSLFDNAAGSPNQAAPGAHRYRITTELVQTDLDAAPENFFELIRVQDGVLQNLVNASQYNILEETLARRTFDESGNYVVDNFKFELREARLNNRGIWSAGSYQIGDYVQSTGGRYFECLVGGVSAGVEPASFDADETDETTVVTDNQVRWRRVSSISSNRGLSLTGSSSDMVAVYGLGKAYVQGFEVNKVSNSNITIPKARDVRTLNNASIPTPVGNYIWLERRFTHGVPDITATPVVKLYDRTVGTRGTQKFGYGNQVGTARATWVEPDARGGIRLGLSDIAMSPGRSFNRDANSVIIDNDTVANASTSYTLSGLVRYAGSSTSTYLAINTMVGCSATAAISQTWTGIAVSAFTQELSTGDIVTVATSSNTSTWTVVAIPNNTSVTLTGSIVTANVTFTSLLVRTATGGVRGSQTGSITRFQSEYRVGDTVWLGVASTATTGTVLSIASERLMFVTSVVGITATGSASTSTATSAGVFYNSQVAKFAGDVWDNYALGINARKLPGSFLLQDYFGGSSTVTSHTALRIVGTTDSRLLSELATNDLVDINDNRIFITKISSNTVAFGVCLDGNITPGAAVSSLYSAFRINNTVVDSNNNRFLYPVAPTLVSNITDNVFTVYRSSSITGVNGLSSFTLTMANVSGTAAAEAIATTDPNAYYVAQTQVASLTTPANVVSVAITDAGPPQVVTVTCASNFAADDVRVVWPVVRAAATGNDLGRLRSKTLQLGVSQEFLGTSAASLSRLVLNNTDVYRIVKVLQATSFVASWDSATQASASDVTSRYELDDGQRDTFYGLAALQLRPGVSPATGSIKVWYDYFSHGSGDFFALASYNNQVPVEQIPDYNGVSLANYLDFRTSINSSTLQTTNVSGLGLSAPPRFGTNFIADFGYYLGRKEKIFLDRTGVFYNVSGASDVNPSEPVVTANNNSIHLNTITLTPYTERAEFPHVAVQSMDNRRYTMRDIGSIERRVVNLEEASVLSLLEAKTSALQIRDNLDSTLERYKTGFFVDNFSDASNADHTNDGRFSLDDVNRTIQPFVEYFTMPLVEKINYTKATVASAELTPARAARLDSGSNYAITGDLLTLSYTTSVMMQQILATTSISVAPFLTATFIGRMRVVPDQDIYENVMTVNQVVGSESSVTNTVADAVAAYRATGDWRPYRVALTDAQRLVGTDRTAEFIPFCRANTIMMIARGLKANSKHYAFFDDVNIGNYISGAVKLTFDSMDILDFEGSRAAVRNEVPRQRSLAQSLDILEVVRAIRFRRRRRWRWRYEYGLFRRTLLPRNFEQRLPSPASRDAYRQALGFGPSVYYREGAGVGTLVGTAVAVHQVGTTLYMINGRGKLSASFLRNQPNQSYNYTGTFHVSVETGDTKRVNTSLAVTVGSALTSNEAGELFSDEQGTVVALFDLADTDEQKFLAGRRPIVITDHPTNHPDDWTSRAEGNYLCEGFNVTLTNNFVSTKVFVARPYDPIAQSFKLPTQYENGAFITDVDLYFQAKPVAEQAPVMLEVRTCDSTGRPSATEILPGSEVIKYPGEIEIDDTRGQVATKFTFRQPLYLMPEKNYALVLKSDTKNYRVWIATLGQPDVNTPTSSYSTQATLGSFFKSQDGTLWTEDQFSDMKFRINRAEFSTADAGATVYVVNRNLENAQLPNNPFTFVHGSNKIRVGQRNHGLAEGDRTLLYSEYWHGQRSLNIAASIAGVPVGEIFSSYISSDLTTYQPSAGEPTLTVSDVTMDTYTITVNTPANLGAAAVTGVTSITGGGNDIVGQNNVLYHIVKPRATVILTKPTTLTMQGRMLRGHTYDTDDTAPPSGRTSQSLNLNVDNILNSSHVILTDLNEQLRVTPENITAGGLSEPWTDSFIGIMNLATTTDHVSPAVDMSTLNLDIIQHRVDNPSYNSRLPNPLPAVGSTAGNMVLLTPICSGNTTVSFNADRDSIDTTTQGLFSNVGAGKYLIVSGSSAPGNVFVNTGVRVLSVNGAGTQILVSSNLTTTSSGTDLISIHQIEDYVEETTAGGATGESKYITKQVDLRNPASQLKMLIEVNIPGAADFDVYYRTGSAGSDLSNTIWRKFIAPLQTGGAQSSYAVLNKTETRGVFTDVEINISDFDSTGTPIDLAPFTAFQVKLVMRTSNGARIPQFRNLRVIAHA